MNSTRNAIRCRETTFVPGEAYRDRLKALIQHTDELDPSLLISATYDGGQHKAVLKFYHPESQTVRLWYDNTGHRPYCFSREAPDQLDGIGTREDVERIERVKKIDLLADGEIEISKIVAKDPLAIGGAADRAIRNLITAWEADIKYYENFLYDRAIVCGTFYRIHRSQLRPVDQELTASVAAGLRKAMEFTLPHLKPHLEEWARLLGQPLPPIKRAALDIEVAAPEENRIPDPSLAEHPVVAASFVGTDDVEEVFLLRRPGVEAGDSRLPETIRVRFFEQERDLIEAVFERILDYPVIVTFNGDDFDLHYLYNRATKKFMIPREDVPIAMGNNVANLKHGVHIDLYKTFSNRSVQVYAFGNRYYDHTLEGVSEALLGESKIEFEGLIGALPLYELARYCHNDARITFRLTSFDDDLLMKLLVVLARVAKMPIDDVARIGVSNWIRSLLYYEHRRLNALIPRSEELEAKGGADSEAIIKGKKYKGGLVVEPEPGVHFNVAVLDFASLYPSIIKVHNLSYETVRCGHGECRLNLVPETSHWVCKRRHGMASVIIGSLRDLRVHYYKPLVRDRALSKEEHSLYHVVSQALKVILNASYGVMGAEIFPLYCLPVAEATAAFGRDAISKTITKCKELGIRVVYGDTDSLFLQAPTEHQIEAVSTWAEHELGIELDLEKTYRYVAFSERKKNYLGVLPDGTVDVKGLTGKKSHTPPFIKRAFYDTLDILSKVRSPQDFEQARELIKKDLRAKYVALKHRQIPLEDLAFNVMMSKPTAGYKDTTPQHVKAAKLLEGRRELKAGDIISFIKTTTPPGVKPVELARPEEADTEKYLEYLRSTFDQFLDALGYEFDEILGVTKLEDFFWSS